jgi:hypothetical protein
LRRVLLVPAIVTVLFFASVPAAFAGEARGVARGHEIAGARGGPSESGSHHALVGSSKGMNRPGSPGRWKDRGHVPAPNSFPQGRSPSDPDGDGNGGLDKPGETGGFSDDRDGNNGCGNDDDREDDNNGWCGRARLTPPGPPSVGPPGPPGPSVPPPVIEPVPPSIPPPPTRVLPRGPVEGPAPGVPLATTGQDIGDFLFAGFGSIVAGVSMRRRRR